MGALSHVSDLWLDVTRTLTRIGRGPPTGIDRVELQYLKTCLASGGERFLCRTTRGYLLLDARGGQWLLDLAEGRRPLGRADLVSRLSLRGDRPRHRAEAGLRALAVDRCMRGGLHRLTRRQGSGATVYLNIGHSNLSEEALSAFGAGRACVVMVHDLIPITHPDLVATAQPENFAGRIARVRRHATHVLANSKATATALARHWADPGRTPPISVAPLGVEPAPPVEATRDPGHFVMLGTIDPRKNHAMMVDVWDDLAREYSADRMPHLHIIGKPGWGAETLIARLDGHVLWRKVIHLHGALPDAEVHGHLAKANALLFPSITEGYGFPPIEAALAGATPVCSDLAVFRETLGDCGVYVNNPTAYHWKETIKQLFDGTLSVPDLTKVKCPTWQEHFEIVAETVISRDVRGRS